MHQLDDIKHRFNYHRPPNERVVDAHTSVRDACRTAAEVVVLNTPSGREQSLAIRKLEEAMFWANAAIARNHSSDLYAEPAGD